MVRGEASCLKCGLEEMEERRDCGREVRRCDTVSLRAATGLREEEDRARLSETSACRPLTMC